MLNILVLVLLTVLLFTLVYRPRRALVAIVLALVAAVVLVEGGGLSPRIGVVAGALVGLVTALWRPRAPMSSEADLAPADIAWARLSQSAGFVARQRIAGLKRRRDMLAHAAEPDPLSPHGELRLKLERRVPELIDNYLDEALAAAPARRRAVLSELLAEIEDIVARTEATDPAAATRGDRRAALRAHLRSGSDRDPIG